MSKNTVESIEEQIRRLQEKKKDAIERLEKTTGKKFLEAFDLRKSSPDEIEKFIDELKSKYQSSESLSEEKEHVGFTHN
ncbi:hypothetical protein MOD71_18740 [Bacillus haynesii]|uniref:hypothetical protein n=1 Tax=Bacillus haynesii TaxID=1925021 RepID=UPI00227EDAE0|nr:hypothetical protein [Bacillus haynesii]MCY8737545.1 hypothetical protein [Bacillus haynesii]